MRYLAALALLCIAYPLGGIVGRIAAQEVHKSRQYLYLARDVFFLASIAVAAFAHGQTLMQYWLPLLIIISYFWLWSLYEHAYPFMLPIVLAASMTTSETLVLNGTLLCMSAFTSASIDNSSLKKARDYLKYWPVVGVGAVTGAVLLLI